MHLAEKLSCKQGRKDQQPNIELGHNIARTEDQDSLKEIKQLLNDQDTSSAIMADFLKVLEAIGETRPDLISDFYPELSKNLRHEKNFIVWRAMCVLSQIAALNKDHVYKDLGRMLQVMDKGSVITRDHGFDILVCLYHEEKFRRWVIPLMEEQLLKAPDNQFGQYAEKWLAVIATKDASRLLKLVQERFPELMKTAHQKRAAKIILKLLKKAKQ